MMKSCVFNSWWRSLMRKMKVVCLTWTAIGWMCHMEGRKRALVGWWRYEKRRFRVFPMLRAGVQVKMLLSSFFIPFSSCSLFTPAKFSYLLKSIRIILGVRRTSWCSSLCSTTDSIEITFIPKHKTWTWSHFRCITGLLQLVINMEPSGFWGTNLFYKKVE